MIEAHKKFKAALRMWSMRAATGSTMPNHLQMPTVMSIASFQ